MVSGESVTTWIGYLQAGNTAAAQRLWERYFRRLVGLARHKLHDTPRQAADEEDVALSAFDSFCRGAARGLFPQLTDRDDLWRLLVTLTARKALQLTRRERRQKRRGAVLGDSGPSAVEQFLSREPTPAFAAEMAEECERLLGRLGSAELRSIALWKMEGDTTLEIAAKLGRAPRTVERKLRAIRTLWEKEPTP